jgi:hypothetical protein
MLFRFPLTNILGRCAKLDNFHETTKQNSLKFQFLLILR